MFQRVCAIMRAAKMNMRSPLKGRCDSLNNGDASPELWERFMSCELITSVDLARRLRLSPDTILRWAREGKIPSIRISPKVLRFDADDVAASLKRGGK